MFAPPFDSARAAITPDILQGEVYVLGTAVIQTTFLVGQVVGAAGGGVAVALSACGLAGLDATTFVLSGLFIGLGTRSGRPRPGILCSPRLARMRDGFRLVFGDRAMGTLLLLGWLVSFTRFPRGSRLRTRQGSAEGPSLPDLRRVHRTQHRHRDAAVQPVLSPASTDRLDGPAGRAHLRVTHPDGPPPGPCASLVIFSLSAAFGVYQIAANTAFVVRVPNERRAEAFGIASMGVIVGQGAAFVAAGAAAEVMCPALVVAVAGAIGTVIAFVLALRWRHVSPPGGRHAAGRRPSNAAHRVGPLRYRIAAAADTVFKSTCRALRVPFGSCRLWRWRP